MKCTQFFFSFGFFVALAACGNPDQPDAADTPPEIEGSISDTTPATPTNTEKMDTFRLVMLGDSITAGYGLKDSRLLSDGLDAVLGDEVTLVNAGVSGDRMQDAAGRFDWSVGPDADGVLIALGGNDLLRGIEPDVTRDNLEALLKRAKERGLWVAVAGLRAPGNASAEFAAAFNAVYDELTAQYCVPLFPNFLQGVIGVPELNQEDGIHPNPDGVAVLVGNLGPWVNEALAGAHDPC